MAAPSVTFCGTNINDGTTYSILPDGNLGAPIATFSEYRGYGGDVTQYNVSTANLVQVVLPMVVFGTSVSGLRGNLAALNALIASCSASSPGALVFDSVSYSIVSSSQVAPDLTQSYQNKFFCFIDLVLNRLP
jgi:hypothetical protein